MEFIFGKTVENTSASTKKIKNMELESISGMMAEFSKANGEMAKETEKERYSIPMAPKKVEFGKTISEWSKSLLNNSTKTLRGLAKIKLRRIQIKLRTKKLFSL